MFLMPWILKLVNRQGWFTEKTRKDLDIICEIDHTRRNLHLKGKTGWRKWTIITLIKIGKWMLMLPLMVLFLALFVAMATDGNADLGDKEEQFVYAFLYLVFSFILLGVPEAIASLGWKDKLLPTTISRRSLVLYEHLGEMTSRSYILSQSTIILLVYLELFLWKGTSFPVLTYYYTKVVLCSFVFLSILRGMLHYLNDYFPRSKRGYIIQRSLGPLPLTMVLVLFVIIYMAALMDSVTMLGQTIYLFLPLAPHFLFAAALVDYPSALVSLVILIPGTLLAAKLELIMFSHQSRIAAIAYREPELLRKAEENLRKMEMKKRGMSPGEEGGDEKDEILKPREFGSGVSAFFYGKVSLLPELPPRRGVFLLILGAFCLFLIYIMFLLSPLVGAFVLVMVLAPALGSTGGKNPFDHPLVHLIPEDPQSISRNYLHHLARAFSMKYFPAALLFSILLLIPMEFGTLLEHSPDFETAAILLTIMPFHLLAFQLLLNQQEPENNKGDTLLTTATLGWIAYFVLFIPYVILLFLKFDFLFDSFLISWVFHLLLGLCGLFASWCFFQAGIMDCFHGGRLLSMRHTPSRKERLRFRNGTLAILLVLALMLGFMVYPSSLEFKSSMIFPENDFEKHQDELPEKNVLIYSEDTLIQDEYMNLTNNMVIEAELRLDNCQLFFRDDHPGELGLYVTETGQLIMENCSLGAEFGLRFEVYGNLSVRGSELSGLWGDRDELAGDGGVEIYAKKGEKLARFENTTITGGPANGIMAWGSELEVYNCSFTEVKDDPIEIRYGRARIENSSFFDCGDGINAEESQLQMANLSIENCSEGLVMQDCNGQLLDSEISYCGDGIILRSTDLKMENTTIHHCRNGMLLRYSDPVLTRCTIRDIRKRSIKEDDESSAKLIDCDIQDLKGPGFEAFLPLWLLHTLILGFLLLVARPWKWYLAVKEISLVEGGES